MKKGYTLIELMVVLMITSIISLAIFTLAISGRNILINKGLERCELQMISFIYYSQNYCKANNKTGRIYFDTNDYKIMLTCEANEVSVNNISNKVSKVDYRINEQVLNYVDISNLGMIKNEGYIEIKYDKSKGISIFLGAGGVYCE